MQTRIRGLHLPIAAGHPQLSSCGWGHPQWVFMVDSLTRAAPPSLFKSTQGLGRAVAKGLPMKAQFLKAITSKPQEGHTTEDKSEKGVGVETQTCGISPGQRKEHDKMLL